MKVVRVSKPGNYTKETKVTVILGIEAGDCRVSAGQEGSTDNPRMRIKVNMKPSTTVDEFNAYFETVN